MNRQMPAKRKKGSNLKPRSKFTEREDDTLSQLVEEFGEDWDIIVRNMRGRNKRQCKERWVNYLCPRLNVDPWTEAEDQLLLQKHEFFGSKWVCISKFFKNRTDTMVKNRYQMLLRKEKKQERLKRKMELERETTKEPPIVQTEEAIEGKPEVNASGKEMSPRDDWESFFGNEKGLSFLGMVDEDSFSWLP